MTGFFSWQHRRKLTFDVVTHTANPDAGAMLGWDSFKREVEKRRDEIENGRWQGDVECARR
jgi:hypothetical protein